MEAFGILCTDSATRRARRPRGQGWTWKNRGPIDRLQSEIRFGQTSPGLTVIQATRTRRDKPTPAVLPMTLNLPVNFNAARADSGDPGQGPARPDGLIQAILYKARFDSALARPRATRSSPMMFQ